MKIFVQIASYRDPQLPVTLHDCISKAKNPSRLRFCIAHQYDDSEDLSAFPPIHESGARFTILRIPYNESRGVCWARNLIQRHYKGEKFTVHLDSHHRFAKHWDETCVEMILGLQARGYAKPLLTAYLPSFEPETDPDKRVLEAWRMNFDRFTPEGVVFFLPAGIPNWENLSAPVPARFFSAHFTFTLGQHCREVPHDPDFYFHGEEISLAVRSFTHGYDLFHPHRLVAWHEYTRKGRAKQWDDDKQWHVRNTSSLKRNRCLLGVDNEAGDIEFGKFALGSIRTIHEYQEYAGVRFQDRAVQPFTLSNASPPNPPPGTPEADWKYPFKRILTLPKGHFPENDYDFWCVAFHNATGQQLYRQDAGLEEIEKFRSINGPDIRIERTFRSPEPPADCVVWPHSVSKGWCPKMTLRL